MRWGRHNELDELLLVSGWQTQYQKSWGDHHWFRAFSAPEFETLSFFTWTFRKGFWVLVGSGWFCRGVSPLRSAMASAEITRTGASLRRTGSRFWTRSGREVFSRSARDEDDEEALKWAVIQKLPTYNRLKKGLLKGSEGDFSEVDIQNLGSREKKNLLERLVKTAVLKVHQDFLHNQTSFYDFLIMGFRVASIFFRVGIVLPEVEVRFEHLTVGCLDTCSSILYWISLFNLISNSKTEINFFFRLLERWHTMVMAWRNSYPRELPPISASMITI